MHDGDRAQPSRRLFLGASAGTLAAVCPFAAQASGGRASAPPAADRGAPIGQACEPFYGSHQGGIVTPTQAHTYFAAFDVLDTHDAGLQSGYGAAAGPAKPVTRADLSALMRRWTEAAARMTQGKTASDQPADLTAQPADSGDAIGLAPARLTLTFGFGGGLFARDGARPVRVGGAAAGGAG